MFLSQFKHAHLKPLLKKSSLPANDLNSYRLIFNLSFISKVLEKVLFCRLNAHSNCKNLSNVFQSAYRQFHSTETALRNVHNDIALNMDKGKVTALTLLDLSAAFDTIDYSVLLDRLHDWSGISGTALARIRSINKNKKLFCDVPQISVLGPLLFTLYTTPLSSLIRSHKLDRHLHADDTQAYISLSTADIDLCLKQFDDCLSDISGWMTNNKLRLNADKTDLFTV